MDPPYKLGGKVIRLHPHSSVGATYVFCQDYSVWAEILFQDFRSPIDMYLNSNHNCGCDTSMATVFPNFETEHFYIKLSSSMMNESYLLVLTSMHWRKLK
jgi:hypothetical protein